MPLNPQLHSRLQRLFGRVEIVNPGDEGLARIERRAGGRAELCLDVWGESYKLRCPFCRDHSPRLSINYRYGTADPAGGRFPINYLCKCFNEECLPGNARNRRDLAEKVLAYQNRNARTIAAPFHAHRGHSKSVQSGPVPQPGELVGLNELDETHIAITYLRERGFDLAMARNFDLSYCVRADGRFRQAQGRIIIPVDFDGVRVGWQGRYVGTPPPNVPKYYTCPGMAKSRILYNFDRARQHPFLVVTEGVTDAWRLGEMAVAIFGHDLSAEQTRLLRTYSGRTRPVFMLLDGEEVERNQRCVGKLRALGIPTASIQLPHRRDPADCSREELLSLVHAQFQHTPQGAC